MNLSSSVSFDIVLSLKYYVIVEWCKTPIPKLNGTYCLLSLLSAISADSLIWPFQLIF